MNDKEQNPWRINSSKKIYDNPWIKVQEDQVTNPIGNPGIYTTVQFKNYALGIIPIDEEGYTWLVGQYRYPLGIYSWEIPMGGGPLEDELLDSAKRELKEETGLVANKWEQIMKIHTSNAVCNEEGYVYLAFDLKMTECEPDETEVLQTKKIHFSEVYEMAINGKITDAISLAGILKAKTILDNQGA